MHMPHSHSPLILYDTYVHTVYSVGNMEQVVDGWTNVLAFSFWVRQFQICLDKDLGINDLVTSLYVYQMSIEVVLSEMSDPNLFGSD